MERCFYQNHRQHCKTDQERILNSNLRRMWWLYYLSRIITIFIAWKSWTGQQCLCGGEQGWWKQEADQVRHDQADVGKLASINMKYKAVMMMMMMLVLPWYSVVDVSVSHLSLTETDCSWRYDVTQQQQVGPTPSTSREGRYSLLSSTQIHNK